MSDNDYVEVEIEKGDSKLNLKGDIGFVSKNIKYFIEEIGVLENNSYEKESYNDNELNKNTEDSSKVSKLGLEEYFEITGDYPLIFNKNVVPGESQKEALLNASIILVYLWNEHFEEGRMKTSKLKDALNDSDFNSGNLHNAWELKDSDRYFSRKGRGPSATIQLRRPGKREAKKLIKGILGR